MDALQWIREQGMVLQSAHGPVPNLAEYVAGEPIRGSRWGHKAGHEIFAVLGQLLDSPDVVATRLINGKVTLIHRRLWPPVVRVADRFPPARLTAVDEEHTATGAHRTTETGFPSDADIRGVLAFGIAYENAMIGWLESLSDCDQIGIDTRRSPPYR